MASILGNVRLTVAIAAMAICSITVAISAVVAGLFVSLSDTNSADVAKAANSATRITTEILSVNLPSLEACLDKQDNVAALTMRSMPRCRNDRFIDTVASVSSQNASIYVYNTEVSPDFNIGMTSLLTPDEERLIDRPIMAGTELFDAMVANEKVLDSRTINGISYATRYQLIAMANGTVIGALFVATDRAPIEAVIG
ncbi:MAG: cache domain-containing protein [Candidatus Devosia symbiotica]|nr:cache domain-containing protein [Candidatus Devosia symbiotica]